jgi:glycosyltransferase involved in cell wall biosynthesis
MKILYAAFRHDPRDIDAASGSDFNYYSAFIRAGAQVELVGPFISPGAWVERKFRRLYRAITGKRYAKFLLSNVLQASRELNRREQILKPDVIFSIFPCSFVFYNGAAPCVYRLDTSFLGWQEAYPEFGQIALRMLVWQERRAFERCSRVVTMSHWSKGVLVRRYGLPEARVEVMANPCALPREVVPSNREFRPKRLETPLRLLLVGRDYQRKGIAIAISAVRQLNQTGLQTELTVCGIEGASEGPVRFAGSFRKRVPAELKQYAELYSRAHLLIHPAVFDPSPIVPAEAAAFGVPTVSNDVGGIATSVAHDVTGIVLPGHSAAEAYVEAITKLIRNPDKYRLLAVGARKRYEEEQNWDVAGRRVMQIVEQAASRRN